VFVDVDPKTFNIDPALIEPAITPKTKAIIPVHLFGQTCDMKAVMEIAASRGIPVIEDVAQACGSTHDGKRLGSIGVFGAFSFYPTKNIGAAGDAGIITTNDDALADKIRRFRDHGRTPSGAFECIGYNSRLDTIQAIYLKYKLAELDDTLLDRIENAKLYNQLFADTEVEVPDAPGDFSHTFNLYTIRVRDRDRLRAYLNEKEIQSAVYYPTPMHLTPALACLGYDRGAFPVAELLTSRCLSLPVWPGLKRRQIERVAEVVKEFLENNVARS
jgi:dTDP-4-amino-4,6-dideoxygalactose transaminase